jgi:hypothetical protein
MPHYLPHGLRQQEVGPHLRHRAPLGSEGTGTCRTLGARPCWMLITGGLPFVTLHTETSPIPLVGDELLGLYACSDPSCIKDDLALLALELDEKVVAGFGCGVHYKVGDRIRAELEGAAIWLCMILHCAWVARAR